MNGTVYPPVHNLLLRAEEISYEWHSIIQVPVRHGFSLTAEKPLMYGTVHAGVKNVPSIKLHVSIPAFQSSGAQ